MQAVAHSFLKFSSGEIFFKKSLFQPSDETAPFHARKVVVLQCSQLNYFNSGKEKHRFFLNVHKHDMKTVMEPNLIIIII